jgi:glutathione S-transferase
MNLLSKSLKPLNEYLEDKDYLIGQFSAADCMLGHSCFMANRFGTVSEEMTNIKNYVKNIESRVAFQKAIALGN